jgi:hypothetical protein
VINVEIIFVRALRIVALALLTVANVRDIIRTLIY